MLHWDRSRWDKALSTALLVGIVGVLGVVGYVVTTPKVGERFTEFYIVGLEGKATDYPKELTAGEEGRVMVGIGNREKVEAIYRIEVRIDGVKNSEVGPVVLGYGQTWEKIVNFTPDKLGDGQKVEFFLYKNEESEPYLKPLHLWVSIKEEK